MQNCKFYRTANCTFGCYKMRGISAPAEQLSASQNGQCSEEWHHVLSKRRLTPTHRHTVTSQKHESSTDRCAHRKPRTALNHPSKACFCHPDNYPPILSFPCNPLLPLGSYYATSQNYLLPESRCQISNYS